MIHTFTYQLDGSVGHFGWTLGCLKLSEIGKTEQKVSTSLATRCFISSLKMLQGEYQLTFTTHSDVA